MKNLPVDYPSLRLESVHLSQRVLCYCISTSRHLELGTVTNLFEKKDFDGTVKTFANVTFDNPKIKPLGFFVPGIPLMCLLDIVLSV